MKKINLHVANIGTKMKLKVGIIFVPNESDNQNRFKNIPTINHFTIGENQFINITPTSLVTIDISKNKDKNDSWSSNMQISFNRFQLFQLIRMIRKLLTAFNDPNVNLFIYRNKQLMINSSIVKQMTFSAHGTSNKTAVIEPAVIQVDTGISTEYYEGINFYINTIDNYCSLTYDEFYYLEYELSKLDINEISMSAIQFALDIFGDPKLKEERDISKDIKQNKEEELIDLGTEEDGIIEPLIVHNESRIPDIM